MPIKIYIKSNFVLPGLEGKECLEFNVSKITLREFLEKLSMMSPERLEYVRSGAKEIDQLDWDVAINGMSYENYEEGLAHLLRNGDTVAIRIKPIGGG